MQTFLCHSALGSASSRSPPVTPAVGYAPLGCHAGRACTLGTSAFRTRRARKDRGRDGAGRRAPRPACLWVILSPSQCAPAPQPRGDAEAKCALFFLFVEAEALESRLAFVEDC